MIDHYETSCNKQLRIDERIAGSNASLLLLPCYPQPFFCHSPFLRYIPPLVSFAMYSFTGPFRLSLSVFSDQTDQLLEKVCEN